MTNELTVRVEHPELPAIRWSFASSAFQKS